MLAEVQGKRMETFLCKDLEIQTNRGKGAKEKSSHYLKTSLEAKAEPDNTLEIKLSDVCLSRSRI